MLQQLKQQDSKADKRFRDDLVRMLQFMRITQLMITSFHSSELVKTDKTLKPIKRFSQEVFGKLEWFQTVVKKMAGENAPVLDSLLDMEGDKINNIAELSDFIASKEADISNEVDLMVNAHRRKEIMKNLWVASRTTFSPKMQLDLDDFDKWYGEQFPS